MYNFYSNRVTSNSGTDIVIKSKKSKLVDNSIMSILPIDVDAQVLFDKWTSLGAPASTSYQNIANAIITQLKITNQWNNLDSFQVYCFHNRTASLVDWRNPTRQATTLNAYGGDWTINSGFKGNATSFVIDTQFNPFDGGSYKFTINDHSTGIYISTCLSNSTSQAILSSKNSSDVGITLRLDINQIVGVSYVAANTVPVIFSHIGLLSIKRTDAANYFIEKDGRDPYFIGDPKGTLATTTTVNRTIKLLAKDLNGTYSNWSIEKTPYFFAGNSSLNAKTISDIMYQYCFNPLNMIIGNKTEITFVGNSFATFATYQPKAVAALVHTTDYIIHNRSQNGYTIQQLYNDSLTAVFPYNNSYCTNRILFFNEITNTMGQNGGDPVLTYSDLTTYLIAAKLAGFNKIIVTTSTAHKERTDNPNANRQNPANLYDNNTLNGKVRNSLVSSGYATSICDWANDPHFGPYSNGVAGVGEMDTTYYQVDQLHPTVTFGFYYLADNFVTPSLNAYL